MIPLRVKLKGFLCYQDEQEIDFEGSSLWMLAGLNGSGKSAVFDAITYALFGHHRGGSMHAQELINKDSSDFLVEFDFSLDGQLYRVKRTLRRRNTGAAGTQQIFRKAAPNGSGAAWVPVEGTSAKKEFDAWVADNIGLNYETFTSSVLLLQGKAERLLDSTPKGRFEVLAGIVDLERFKKLHEKADERRRELDGKVKNLQDQVAAIPDVNAGNLKEAGERIAQVEAARQQAVEQVEAAQALEFQSRQWVEMQKRLESATQRWRQACGVLDESADIERDFTRLCDLRLVEPKLNVVMQQRNQVHQSETRARDLQIQQKKLEAQLEDQQHALDKTRQQRVTLDKRILEDENNLRQVAAQARDSAKSVEKLAEFERQQADLTRLQNELAQAGDPAETLKRLRAECDQLAGLASALPLLARLHTTREELRKSRGDAEELARSHKAVEEEGKQLRAMAEPLRPQLAEATKERQRHDEQVTRDKTLLGQAKQHLAEILLMEGAKLCRHCGQELTQGHVQDETRRRKKEVADEEKQLQRLQAAQQTAARGEKQLAEQVKGLDDKLAELREKFTEQRHNTEQARKDRDRLERECLQTYGELGEPHRARVSPTTPGDWLETAYPTAKDVEGLRRQAAGLTALRQQLARAEDEVQQWTRRKGQETTLLQTVQRLRGELPPDHAALRRLHADLESQEKALDLNLRALREQVKQTQADLDRQVRERERTREDLTVLAGKLKTEEATQEHCRRALTQAMKELPAPWHPLAERTGLKEVNDCKAEREALEQNQTDARWKELEQARLGVAVLEQEKTALEARQGDFPPESRQAPDQLLAALQQARQAMRLCEEELAGARQQKATLETNLEQRQKLGEELLRAQQEQNHGKMLTDLLGRDRLQLHLVRQCERQVVDHANTILDRLSGGQLYLKLCGEAGGEGNTAKALELESHNRTTGEKPINVSFLSGSQKFRVAVSLALGIGQYASRQHRPIESVIIDEGFGCLDRQGRQVMIQELHNLRGQMRCILLVSHQEEFAEAFADGYRFELTNGSTVATRFQR